jgi:hypothetical protein
MKNRQEQITQIRANFLSSDERKSLFDKYCRRRADESSCRAIRLARRRAKRGAARSQSATTSQSKRRVASNRRRAMRDLCM